MTFFFFSYNARITTIISSYLTPNPIKDIYCFKEMLAPTKTKVIIA